jgi:acyl carrier protein
MGKVGALPDTAHIRETIVAFICDELRVSPEELSDATDLRELPGAESVKILRVVAKIERAFQIELDDEIVFRVESLGELVQAVASQTAQAAGR